MRSRVWLIVMAALLLGALPWLSGCKRGGEDAPAAASGQKFHCPMHPTYISDRMGDCPICNMKLVPIKGGTASKKTVAKSETSHIAVGQWYCPMFCDNSVSNAPGTCPECNMKLVQKTEADAAAEHAHEEPAEVPGRVSLMLAPEKRQLIGLTLSKVEPRALTHSIRAVAVVEHDETRYTRIAPRFSGWVRQLHVNFTGAPVEKGQPLFAVYSPELFSSENEYLVAWRAAQQAGAGGTVAGASANAEALLESARMRLGLFQVGEEEIRELEKRGKASAELLFRAPFSGHILKKNAVEGQAFQAGETLFEVADLSRLWLRASIYEFEMPFLAMGQKVTVQFPYLGTNFESEVSFVYPHIDPQTRRGEFRLELDNPAHLLRPDMWANVELRAPLGERLTVPASSVIDTGTRYLAFVNAAEDHLEPREVKIGARTDDYYEVLSGLREGDQVVTRALFLVDSESQLKAAILGMVAASSAEPAAADPAPAAAPAEAGSSGHQH